MIASEIQRTDEDGDNTEYIVLNGNDISGLPALKWHAFHNYPVTQWGSMCIFAVNTKAIFDYEIRQSLVFKVQVRDQSTTFPDLYKVKPR